MNYRIETFDRQFGVPSASERRAARINRETLAAVAKVFRDVLTFEGYDSFPERNEKPEAAVTFGDLKAAFNFETDTDHDGLSDAWERRFFGTLKHGAHEDSDGDLASNRQEFLDGTNPNDVADYRREIYIALRADGKVGSGTKEDPYDGSGDRFNQVLRHYSGVEPPNHAYPIHGPLYNLTVHLEETTGPHALPMQDAFWAKPCSGGEYVYPADLPGFVVLRGWRIIGGSSDRGKTIVRLNEIWKKDGSHVGANINDKGAIGTVFGVPELRLNRSRDISIKNLTIDCQATKWSTTLVASFPQPPASAPQKGAKGAAKWIVAKVADAKVFKDHLNREVFIQESGRVSNGKAYGKGYGTYLIRKVDTSTVPHTLTLQNVSSTAYPYTHTTMSSRGHEAHEIPAGEMVPKGARIFLRMQLSGIQIGETNCLVENVRVTNTCHNQYEGCSGIAFLSQTYRAYEQGRPQFDGGDEGTGNVIRNCLVDNIWGPDSAAILICGWNYNMDNKGGRTTDGTILSVLVEGNEVIGNGYTQQGYGLNATQCSILRNNKASGVGSGIYADNGETYDLMIERNIFTDVWQGIYLGGGGPGGEPANPHSWKRVLVANNKITAMARGIHFGGLVSHSTILENVITLTAPTSSDFGIGLQESHPELANHSTHDLAIGNLITGISKNLQYYLYPNCTRDTPHPTTYPFSDGVNASTPVRFP